MVVEVVREIPVVQTLVAVAEGQLLLQAVLAGAAPPLWDLEELMGM